MNWQQVHTWKEWAGNRFIPRVHGLATSTCAGGASYLEYVGWAGSGFVYWSKWAGSWSIPWSIWAGREIQTLSRWIGSWFIPRVPGLAEILYLECVGWQQFHTWNTRGGRIFISGKNVVAAYSYLEKMWMPHIHIC
jgi:hypothetical protein